MVRGAKEELLRSNTQKVTKLEGKKGGAAPEQLRSSSGAAPEQLRSSSGAERSREEQGGAEEIDKKLSKTKTNSETHFRPNNIIIEFSLITATFWIPHTSFYVQD